MAIAISVTMLADNSLFASKVYLDFQASFMGHDSPDNWNGYTPYNAYLGNTIELVDEFNIPTGISFRFDRAVGAYPSSQSSGFPNQASSNAPRGLGPMHEFSDWIALQTTGQRLQFSGFTPGKRYNFWLLGWSHEASKGQPMNLSVSGAGDWTYINNQGLEYFSINGEYGAHSRTFDSYAARFVADSTGTLSFEAESGEYLGIYGALLEPADSTNSATILPTFDAQAVWNGVSYDVSDGYLSITTQSRKSRGTDNRAIMEFSLENIPDSAIITSATLTIDVRSLTSSETQGSVLRLLGYDLPPEN